MTGFPFHCWHETVYVQCLECQHFHHTAPGGVLGERRCAAYRFGIPLRIALGLHDHREPYPDDRGIRFAPAGVAPPIAGLIPIETDGREATGGRPQSLPPALEERIKSALRRAGRPCTITDIRSRLGTRRPKSAPLRAALANLLEGGEIRTTIVLRETDPRGPVRPRRGLVFYELGPGA